MLAATADRLLRYGRSKTPKETPMISSRISMRKLSLLATVAPLSLAIAAPAFAQSQTADEQPASADAVAVVNTALQEDQAQGEDIIVTGSILRTTDAEKPSPVTVVSTEALDQRGVSSIQEGIQQLVSNNGPALTNSFTANGAFAQGASAVSLRGLTTNSTLVLFDGLRAAYYPLSDDGTRNFVDLNTIPDEIVDRIEVLRDGASSSYGADAIAGVVNIITKREYQGIGGRAEAGITQRGDAGNQRLSLIAGVGDLEADGFNVYASGFYINNDLLYNNQRPYPYNTSDQRGICFEGECGPNNIINGLDINGDYPGFAVSPTAGTPAQAGTLYVRPYDATNTTALGRFQYLNPADGCDRGVNYALTADELADDAAAPTNVCQVDIVNNYGVISPQIERFGGSARFTATVGDAAEAYLLFNFQQSTAGYPSNPPVLFSNGAAGINFPRYSTATVGAPFAPGSGPLTLPVFVCAARVDCDTAADRTLNPNNPFAAQGQVARLLGALPGRVSVNETRSRVYRVAGGISGRIADEWDYKVDVTAMHNDLRRTSSGYVYIQHLLDVIADGTYNFVDPSQNSQAIQDYLTPDNINDSSSDLYQAQATIGRALFELPGGDLQLGLGAAIRYEAIDAPSGNSDINGPTERYFTLNAFGTKGDRTVYSGFAELNAPILEQVDVNLSGRYDKYSSGQSAFSPKIGVKVTPIRQLAIRGTYSRGFRIPSIAETSGLPTSGFVTTSATTYSDAFLAQYGCSSATFASCPTYIRTGSFGQTSLSTPDLEPEKSRSFTGGVIFEPTRDIVFTVDYYNIRKTGAITTLTPGVALAAYSAGAAIPPGYNIIADSADPAFPNARPRVAFIQSNYVNANTVQTSGIDASLTGTFDIANDVRFTSSAQATYIIELSTTFADGTKEQYEGTLGNFNLTAGSGTPEWRASWQNTVEAGKFSLTGTAQYFDGYDLSAADQGGTQGDCSLAPAYAPCRVDSYITVDLVGSVRVNDRFTFYAQVLNAFDDLPPIDVVTYGANLYNPVQGGTGILGRSFRAGIRVGL
jgi:iron complex outermembrane receptor protein